MLNFVNNVLIMLYCPTVKHFESSYICSLMIYQVTAGCFSGAVDGLVVT